MKPKQQDLELYRGDDEIFYLKLSFTDGTPLPLDALKFDLHVIAGGEQVIALSTANGLISVQDERLVLHFSHELTDKAEWKTGRYDLQFTDANGLVRTVLRGKLNLIHDITQDDR